MTWMAEIEAKVGVNPEPDADVKRRLAQKDKFKVRNVLPALRDYSLTLIRKFWILRLAAAWLDPYQNIDLFQ